MVVRVHVVVRAGIEGRQELLAAEVQGAVRAIRSMELRSLVPERGRTVRGFQWVGAYVLSVALALVGGAAWAFLPLAG